VIALFTRRRDAQRQRRVLAVLLLHTVLQVDPPSGYLLGRATGDSAAVHVALAQLERDGYVAGEWEKRSDGQPRRRFYRLTDAGRMHAGTTVARWLRGDETR
jgi:DNA-binding PadR family transcriptional regulator